MASDTKWCAALLAIFVLVAIPACGGDEGESGGASGGEPAASAAAGEDTSGDTEDGGDSGSAEGTSGEGGDTGGGTEDTGTGGDPNARFNLIASPDNVECSYVPGGHLSGADLLNVHFYFLIIGGNPPDVPPVSVTGQSDTGLTTSYNGGPHNQAVNTAQFALREGDFGRSHSVTLTVDAGNEVSETSESDNRIRVSVALPSPRPTQTIDPLSCSATSG